MEVPISNGNSMEYLKEKLKCMKKEIKLWNKEVFSSSMKRKRELLVEIEEIDSCDDVGALQDDMRVKRVDLFSQLRCL